MNKLDEIKVHKLWYANAHRYIVKRNKLETMPENSKSDLSDEGYVLMNQVGFMRVWEQLRPYIELAAWVKKNRRLLTITYPLEIGLDAEFENLLKQMTEDK